jgi:hypothetical protein
VEIFLLFLGAILGVVFDRLSRVGHREIRKIRERERIKKIHRGSDARAVWAWLVDYYGPDELLHCSISGATAIVPFFANREWSYSVRLSEADSVITEVTPPETLSFPVNTRLLSLRASRGQKLFDDAAYYVNCVDASGRFPQMEIARTQYFSVASNLIALEEEVFRSVLTGRRRAPLRDKYLGDMANVMEFKLKPLSVGAVVGFVLKSDLGHKIMIQTRSRQTVTYGGTKALFPSFGLAPLGNLRLSPEDLLYLNFVKEYLEEFYGYDELIESMSQKRLDSRWFMKLPQALALDEARRDGNLEIYMLGFGIDCLSGNTTIAILAELSDEELGREIVTNAAGNWEVADPTIQTPSLEVVDLFSEKLGLLLESCDLHTGSAFALNRIQHHYKTK